MSNKSEKLEIRKAFRLNLAENRKLEYHSKSRNQNESTFIREFIQSLSDPPLDPIESIDKLENFAPQENISEEKLPNELNPNS